VNAIEGAWEEALPDVLLAEMAKKGVFFVPVLSEQGDLASLLDAKALKEYLDEPIVQIALTETLKKSLASDGGMLSRLREGVTQGPELLQAMKEQQERAFSNVRRARAAGVQLALGTGSGNFLVFPGAAVHRELELLVRAGLSPSEAIVAATRNTARLLGRGDELGTIEPGKIADLLILAGDPTSDIRNTQKIERVIQNGRLVRAEDLAVR
jgi:imidazolonepropionase-like amidohydrolase